MAPTPPEANDAAVTSPQPVTAASGSRAPGPAPGKRPTIRDVAREAGVSHATVSRVLNGGQWVGAESRRVVEEVIARTGYTTNQHARSLATGRSGSVAFLLTEPHQLLFEDPNFAVLLRGVAEVLSERGRTLVLMIASTEPERDRVMEFLAGGHADGVLLVSSRTGEPLLARLAKAKVPTVSCGRVAGFEGVLSSVSADDAVGARSAVEHLVRSGCRRIATIAGPLDTGGAVDRLRGYLDALAKHDLPKDDRRIAYGDWSRDSGREAMLALLAADPDLDAVFVANDQMAAGALTALRGAGRQVPQDVHVVGFDDSGMAATLEPPLTSVRQPFARMCQEMVRLVCDTADREPASVVVATSLIVRESAPG